MLPKALKSCPKVKKIAESGHTGAVVVAPLEDWPTPDISGSNSVICIIYLFTTKTKKKRPAMAQF